MKYESFKELREARKRHWKRQVFRYGNNTIDHIDFDIRWKYTPFVKRKRKSYLAEKKYRHTVYYDSLLWSSR